MESPAGRLAEIEPSVILNGDFPAWQRGTSFGPASGAFTADRIKYEVVGAAQLGVDRSTDVPTFAEALNTPAFSVRVNVDTVDGTVDAADAATLQYNVEGQDYRPLHGGGSPMYLSFWAKANVSERFYISLRNQAVNRNYLIPFDTEANVWKRYAFSVPTDVVGTWDFQHQIGLRISFCFQAGTNSHGTANTWQSGNLLSGADQFNFADNIGNLFYFTNLMLLPGLYDPAHNIPFRRTSSSFATELHRLKRYFEKSISYDQNPGSGPGQIRWRSTGTNTTLDIPVRFQVEKPNAPLVETYDTGNNPTAITTHVGSNRGRAILNLGRNGFNVRPDDLTVQAEFGWTAQGEL